MVEATRPTFGGHGLPTFKELKRSPTLVAALLLWNLELQPSNWCAVEPRVAFVLLAILP